MDPKVKYRFVVGISFELRLTMDIKLKTNMKYTTFAWLQIDSNGQSFDCKSLEELCDSTPLDHVMSQPGTDSKKFDLTLNRLERVVTRLELWLKKCD